MPVLFTLLYGTLLLHSILYHFSFSRDLSLMLSRWFGYLFFSDSLKNWSVFGLVFSETNFLIFLVPEVFIPRLLFRLISQFDSFIVQSLSWRIIMIPCIGLTSYKFSREVWRREETCRPVLRWSLLLKQLQPRLAHFFQVVTFCGYALHSKVTYWHLKIKYANFGWLPKHKTKSSMLALNFK